MTESKVAIFASMPRSGYSGGRYSVLLLAAALVTRGYSVHLFSNNLPEMWGDLVQSFRGDVNLSLLKWTVDKDYGGCVKSSNGYVGTICAPDMSPGSVVYARAVAHSQRSNSPLTLLNFESPSWFNEIAPVKRDPRKWKNWFLVAGVSNFVMSFAVEASKYAKRDYKVGEMTSFVSVHAPLNSPAILRSSVRQRVPGSVFFPGRIKGGEHKGLNDLRHVVGASVYLRHAIFVLDDPGDPVICDLLSLMDQRGITYEVHSKISEEQKFSLLAKSQLVLVASEFEGFGYSPVEALAMGTPCLVRRLPIFDETCGEDALRLPLEARDWASAIDDMLASIDGHVSRVSARASHYRENFSLHACGEALETELRLDQSVRPPALPVRHRAFVFTSCHFRPLERENGRLKRAFWRAKQRLFSLVFRRPTLRQG